MMSGQDQGGLNFGQLAPIQPGQQGQQQGQQQQPPQMQNAQLSPIAPKQGVIAQGQAPSDGGGGAGDSGGIGGLLKGLAGLAGGVSKAMNSPVPGPSMGTSQPQMRQQSPQMQQQQSPFQSQMGQAPKNVYQQYGNNIPSNQLQGITQNSQIFNNAMKQYGMKEGDPTLMHYLAKANPGLNPASTPWCAGYVGSVLNASGLKGTGSLSARSYLNYGQPTSNPTQGDIVVFKDLTGRNDPNHGHVGFVSKIDEKSGMVYTLGGNEDNSVTVKPYPMSQVLGFRTPPSGQQVQQVAEKSGIQSPQQLAQITQSPQDKAQQLMGGPRMNSVLSSPQQAVSTIAKYEQYDHTAKWDVNAFRAGYGSDTVTMADGSVHKITQGMNVSPEDAMRDLTRRTNEFATNSAKQVGDGWSKLSPGTQTALTSLAYNHGSLPSSVVEAARSGDPSKIAKSITDLSGWNKGTLADRRRSEAKMVMAGNNPQQPMQKEINTKQVNPPLVQPQFFEDAIKHIDQGKDDYSQNKGTSYGGQDINQQYSPNQTYNM